jgi:hypothetical protein
VIPGVRSPRGSCGEGIVGRVVVAAGSVMAREVNGNVSSGKAMSGSSRTAGMGGTLIETGSMTEAGTGAETGKGTGTGTGTGRVTGVGTGAENEKGTGAMTGVWAGAGTAETGSGGSSSTGSSRSGGTGMLAEVATNREMSSSR